MSWPNQSQPWVLFKFEGGSIRLLGHCPAQQIDRLQVRWVGL